MKKNPFYVTKAASLCTIVAGGLVLAGWFLNFPPFKPVLPGLVSMKFITALCFILSGIILYLLETGSVNPFREKIARLGSWILLSTGIFFIVLYLFGGNTGYDGLIGKNEPGIFFNLSAERMSPGDSILFTLLGFVFLFIKNRRYNSFILFTLFVMVSGCVLIIFNHFFGTSFLNIISGIRTTALHTAVLFIILCIGVFRSSPLRNFRLSFQKQVVLFFGFVAVILAWIFSAYKNNLDRSLYTSGEVARSRDVLMKAEELNAGIYEMQSGVIGFIITGADNYPRMFSTAADKVHKIAMILGRMTGWNAAEKSLVDSLTIQIDRYYAFGNKVIEIRRKEGIEAAQKFFTESGDNYIPERIGQKHLALEKNENRRLLEQNAENEKSIRHASGIISIFESFSVVLLVLAIFVINKNIRQRNELENELHKNIRENPGYKFALDQSSIISVTDVDGKITYANDNFCRISKYSREELIGRNHRIINSGCHSKEFFRKLWATILSGNIWRGEIKNKAKDGSCYWVDSTIVPFQDKDGKLYQFLAIRSDITGKKEANDKIKESEFALAEAQRIAHLGSLSADMNGNLTCSEETCRIFGLSPLQMVKDIESFIRLIHPDDRDRIRNWINSCRAGEKTHETEYRIILPNGVVRYLSGNLELKVDAGNKPLYMTGIIRDITDKKIDEDKLIKEKEFSEEIINSLPGLFYMSDPTPRLLKWNKAFAEVSGYSAEELKEIVPVSLFSADDHPVMKKSIEKTYREGFASVEAKMLTKSGIRIPYYFTGVRIMYEGKPAILGTGIDISGRLKAEEAIRKANERFEMVAKATGDAIWDWNIPEDEIWGNESLYSLYGVEKDRQKISVSTFFEHMHPSDAVRVNEDMINALKSGDEFIEAEYRFRSPDGTYKNIIDRAYIIYDTSGKPFRMIGAMRDITEKKKAELDIAANEKRFRSLVENGKDCVVIVDKKGKLLYISPSIVSVLGYHETAAYAVDFKEIFHPDDLKSVKNMIRKSIESPGVNLHGKLVRIKHKKGCWRWIENTITNMIEDPAIGGIVVNFRDITDKINADELLRTSEHKFRTLIQQAADGIFIVDADGNYQDANTSAEMMTGYTREELITMNAAQLISADNLKENPLKIEEVKAGKPVFAERIIRCKDGSLVNAEISAKLIDNGKVIVIMRNISERKKAEKSLSESRQRYISLLDNINDGFVVDDPSGKIILVNKKFLDMFGFMADEIYQLRFTDFIAPEYLPAVRERHNLRMAGEKVTDFYEYEGIRKDGKRIWIETHVSPVIEDGKIAGTQSILRDITERKHAEEERNLLQDSLQKSLNEIYIFDPDTYLFKYINAGALKNLGYTGEEIKKMTPFDLKPAFTQQSFKNWVAPLISGGREKIVFFTFHQRKDGSLYPVEVHLQLIRHLHHKVFLSVVLDITERKKIERELQEQKLKQQKLITEITIQAQEKERNELGRELHDNINQILATVKMYLGMSGTENGLRQELIKKSHAYVEEAMEEIRKLSHSLVTPSLGDIGMKEALEELTSDANYLRNMKIKLVVDENYSENGLDNNKKLMFYRIVQEQLNNIMKYAEAKEVTVTFRVKDGKLFLSVADNGVGFNTSEKSTGIGLRNIKNRVEFYAGEMNVISAPGEGCTLEIIIPG